MPDILKTIVEEHKISNVEYRFKAGDYAPWTYCVQYRESDFDFVSRLLEEEGIYYYFAFEKDRHVLIFGDLPNHHEECAQAQLRVKPRVGGSPHVFWATSWRKEQVLHPGKYALGDYNFLDPSTRDAVLTDDRAQERGFADPVASEHAGDPADLSAVPTQRDQGPRWMQRLQPL